MVLTDDNFGTLVHAVEIGRRVYEKVVSYVRYQMTQLLSLVLLFLAATVFNINQGVAMTPSMVLYLLFFATVSGVVIIAVDPGDPDVMHRPPRDPSIPLTNQSAIVMWLLYALVLFLAAGAPLVAGPDDPHTDRASVSMTMTFVVMGLGTVLNALVNRRDPTSGVTGPVAKAVAIGMVTVAMLFLATQLPTLQTGLLTTALTPRQWLTCAGLAALLPVVVELGKWVRRRRTTTSGRLDPAYAVAPSRARSAAAQV
jgi:P-type Ca2+ transporter type 2C